ncbi:DUF4123 domain-containing protein [Cupriavidus taiwanensis]|uniref:DUF4123 domain-containing protein n=1 Tax=Cupriavidus taiwanensis TaxID=164546 RepID=UPI001559CF13|nr:DUF4123 domain-containing protein [Cupriavidus taiwanensis]
MEFAVDVLIPEAVAAQIVQWQSEQEGLSQWLLVDAMLVDFARIQATMRKRGWSIHNVLEHSRFAAFGDMAPHLIGLPTGDAHAQTQIRQLIASGAAAPAFSWLASSQPMEKVCQTLAYLAMVQVDGDMELHCRFAGTRILPELWRVLTDSQRRRVTQNIASWGCLGCQRGRYDVQPPSGHDAGVGSWRAASEFPCSANELSRSRDDAGHKAACGPVAVHRVKPYLC